MILRFDLYGVPLFFRFYSVQEAENAIMLAGSVLEGIFFLFFVLYFCLGQHIIIQKAAVGGIAPSNKAATPTASSTLAPLASVSASVGVNPTPDLLLAGLHDFNLFYFIILFLMIFRDIYMISFMNLVPPPTFRVIVGNLHPLVTDGDLEKVLINYVNSISEGMFMCWCWSF
jgi:hypothetical protein